MAAAMVGWMDEKLAFSKVGWMAAGTAAVKAAGWAASKGSSTVAAMVVA
jgi:hypothetical protein